MPDESAPLAFLEKSHCVPILLALYRKGMMNRNQLYKELGQTINIVIKRINFLERKGLICEIEMKVKPFAKYIDLTRTGYAIAESLCGMENIAKLPIKQIHSRVHLGFNPYPIIDKIPDEFEPNPEDHTFYHIKWEDLNCPKCKKEMHLLYDEDDFFWLCFDCGTRKASCPEEAFEAWIQEEKLIPSEKRTKRGNHTA